MKYILLTFTQPLNSLLQAAYSARCTIIVLNSPLSWIQNPNFDRANEFFFNNRGTKVVMIVRLMCERIMELFRPKQLLSMSYLCTVHTAVISKVFYNSVVTTRLLKLLVVSVLYQCSQNQLFNLQPTILRLMIFSLLPFTGIPRFKLCRVPSH